MQAVRAYNFSDLLLVLVPADKLFFAINIYAKVARELNYGRCNEHMNFLCAAFAKQLNNFVRSRSANYRVVNKNNSLALDVVSYCVELDTNALFEPDCEG